MKRKLLAFCLVLVMLALACSVPVSAAGDWIDIEDKEPPKDYAYSFVVIGDTQILTYKDATEGTDYLAHIYDWIVENKEEKKIEFVFGLGDITDQDWLYTGAKEWEIAKENISKLDGVVPYTLVRGNHDDETFFNDNFNTKEYRSNFLGFYDATAHDSYRTLEVGKDKYLIITMDHGPSNGELYWADTIMSEYPDHRVIFATHWYLGPNGTPGTITEYGSAKPPLKNHGTEIWDKLIKKHSNVFLTLSGHYSTTDPVIKQRANPAGGTVTQMLVDPQGYDASVEPAGMISILYFSEDGKTIDIEYFSTVRNQYFRASNQRTINVPKFFREQKQTTAVTTDPVTDSTAVQSTAADVTATQTATVTEELSESGCKSELSLPMAVILACPALALSRKKRKKIKT